MTPLSRTPWIWLLPLSLLAACGSNGGGVDTGALDARLADAGRHEAAPATDATTDGAAGLSVAVVYKDQTTPVVLATLTPVAFNGVDYAQLSDIALRALPGVSLDSLVADLESSDGFKPGSKANCDGLLPFPGANLSKGYVDVQSRNMAWDDSIAYPGCMAVKDLAKLLLSDK